MRNLIFTFLLLFVGFAVSASDADLFKLDYESVQKEFAGLEQVSDILADNPEMTYSMLMETNDDLCESVNLMSNSILPTGNGMNFDILSFWIGVGTGCVVSIIIILIMGAAAAS